MTLRHSAAALVLTLAAPPVWSAAFRCEVDGRVIYSDLPCTAGKQVVVQTESPPPSPADRSAAAERYRADKALADKLQREREQRESVVVSTKPRADRNKEVNACIKLRVRVRRAQEDFNTAPLATQQKQRVRMLRAEEDLKALCKR